MALYWVVASGNIYQLPSLPPSYTPSIQFRCGEIWGIFISVTKLVVIWNEDIIVPSELECRPEFGGAVSLMVDAYIFFFFLTCSPSQVIAKYFGRLSFTGINRCVFFYGFPSLRSLQNYRKILWTFSYAMKMYSFAHLFLLRSVFHEEVKKQED